MMWGKTFAALVVLPGASEIHRATVNDRGSVRTVETACGLHETYSGAKRGARPRVFTTQPAAALTSGLLLQCGECQRQRREPAGQPPQAA